MNEDYDPENLLEAIEKAGALRAVLDGLVYDSKLEVIDELIRQAFLARKRIRQLGNPQ